MNDAFPKRRAKLRKMCEAFLALPTSQDDSIVTGLDVQKKKRLAAPKCFLWGRQGQAAEAKLGDKQGHTPPAQCFGADAPDDTGRRYLRAAGGPSHRHWTPCATPETPPCPRSELPRSGYSGGGADTYRHTPRQPRPLGSGRSPRGSRTGRDPQCCCRAKHLQTLAAFCAVGIGRELSDFGWKSGPSRVPYHPIKTYDVWCTMSLTEGRNHAITSLPGG